MLITRDFVLLNMPKTGSTFARQVIRRAYEGAARGLLPGLGVWPPPVRELLLPEAHATHLSHLKTQHGTYQQIPRRYRKRQIVTIARNPLSRYVSAYRFGFWKHHAPADETELRQRYPAYPELTFAEWYDMSHRYSRANRLRGISPRVDLGIFTVQFLQFYFPDPQRVLSTIDESWINTDRWRAEMPAIEFLHQERLNDELKCLLRTFAFDDAQLQFIDQMPAANVSGEDAASSRDDIDKVIRDDIMEKIRHRERLLFRIFPEYDRGGALSVY